MSLNNLVHLYPQARGGVSDYVDVCLDVEPDFRKNSLSYNANVFAPVPSHSLLHYSGYGYAKRGAPLWLLNKIKSDRLQIRTLGIFFHELYAFGPPWGSAFWLSKAQRIIARRLAETCDFWITNREESAQWLRRFAVEKPHAVLPVFSNVGEIPAYRTGRTQKVVVFGSAALRMLAYRAGGATLFSWARKHGFELHDIGPPISDSTQLAELRRSGVVQHGRLEATDVSKVLSDAMFGVLAYSPKYVAKSGVFAAYCAHGVCAVIFAKRHENADGLTAGTHYLAGFPLGAALESIVENIGLAAWKWYQPHRVAVHVNTIRRFSSEADKAC